MKGTNILSALVLFVGLMVWPVSTSHGTAFLTVNSEVLDKITLETGQTCTVEVVSTDSSFYNAYVGFDNGLVLGSFSDLTTELNAGDLGSITVYDVSAFYGYYVSAAGTSPPPSPGVHFIIEYTPQQVGETELKLYDQTLTAVIDSVLITVVPAEMGTTFTYQGRLIYSNTIADGLFDLEFELYDAPSDGNQLGSTIDVNNLDVTDGYFTLGLDFGSDVFDGSSVWMEIGVRPGDSNDADDFVKLVPRHQVTAVPYALQTRGIFVDSTGNVGIGTTNPSTPLHIQDSDARIVLQDDDDPSSYSYLDDAGQTPFRISKVTSSGTSIIEMDPKPMDSTSDSAIRLFRYTNTTGLKRVLFHKGDGTYTADAQVGVDGANSFFSGNVGVGIKNPGARLHVWASDSNESPDNVAGLFVENNGTANNWYVFQTASVGGEKSFSITNAGNVGIGTTSPTAKLTVAGGILRDGSTMYGSTADTHVNLGVNSTTGTDGKNESYVTVGGGFNNTASSYNSTVSGGSNNTASYEHSTVGGGRLNKAGADYATIGGGEGNSANGYRATIGGGEYNNADDNGTTIGGGTFNDASVNHATVGGGFSNAARGTYSTIGGGQNNDANGYGATVSGGNRNEAYDYFATVGGGSQNTADGHAAVVGGGLQNSTNGHSATLGGGWNNYVSGDHATIGGGYNNTASGDDATVPGGRLNEASGKYSFSAGLKAKANHDGSFVWADATDANFASTADNQFLIRASGGVGIGTASPVGQLDVNGSIYQRGNVLHADYVFEPGYELESIDEHSEFMWRNKHLKAIPKAGSDENGQEMLEVGAHRRGIVEELEKAHIYIEQMHKRIKDMELKMVKLEAMVRAIQ